VAVCERPASGPLSAGPRRAFAFAGGAPDPAQAEDRTVRTHVTADGGHEVLGLDPGDREDEVFWRGFLTALKRRGLTGARLVSPTTCRRAALRSPPGFKR
jgi:hypothetical protein